MLTRAKVFSLTIVTLLILALVPGAPTDHALWQTQAIAQGRPTTAAPLEPLTALSDAEATERPAFDFAPLGLALRLGSGQARDGQDRLLSGFSASSVPSVIPSSAGDWHIETVDGEGDVGLYTSLALDGAGRPHISYHDYSSADLKYAWHDGSAWHIETVDSEGQVGSHTSLALDEADRPHISYYSIILRYTWHDGAVWQIETVDNNEPFVGAHASLALDGLGRPHISYYDATNEDLKYAWHDGTAWQIETVDSVGDVGEYTSLALDGSDRPHISYFDCTNGDLKYTWHNGTSWQIETVDSEGYVGGRTSLALNGAGQPHISYDGNGSLKYAWHDGMAWRIEAVDSVVVWYTSLALDGEDQPHISYGAGIIKYAWHNGAGWQIETVDSVGISPEIGPSLAMDGSGRPHISYYDSSNHDLKYAHLMPSPLLDKQASPNDGLRNNDTLTYTLTLSGPGLSVRLWDPLPASVHYITDSVTPAAVYSPTVNAVVWQGTLPTDTAQIIRFQATPGITGAGSLSLSLPIVNTAWMTDTENGASVSATFIVNAWRVYLLPLVMRQS